MYTSLFNQFLVFEKTRTVVLKKMIKNPEQVFNYE